MSETHTRCGETDETCGQRSAIPPCCRDWFRVWTAFVPTAPRWIWRQHPMLRERFGYVACPGCRHCNAKILIRECPCPLRV